MFEESDGEELFKNQTTAGPKTETALPPIGGPLSQLQVLQTTRPGLTNGTIILPSTFGTIHKGEDSVDFEIQAPINQSESIIGSIDTSKLSSFDSPDDENEDRSIKQALKSVINHNILGLESEHPSGHHHHLQVLNSLKQVLLDVKVGLPLLSLQEDAENFYYKSIKSTTLNPNLSDVGPRSFYPEIQV
ncbi:hypothetical protein KEM48_006671 [Puccinia striiformis f. sp. tritici PST-130]|nr:hypothetical protein KEM48_006671 [Puccinia striiformis f. sp. tritici PST-130]KAI9602913.1 hypothetical protein H4Q26_002221 [Puccinia striiformis f. sp. tritici PST-130]